MAYTPYDYMPPSYGTDEDEEERKRREAEEAAAAGLAGPAIPDLQQEQQAPLPAVGTMPEPTDVAPVAPEIERSFSTEPAPAAAPAAGEMEMVNGRLVRKTTPAMPEIPGMPSMPQPAAAPEAQPMAMPQLPQPGPGVQVASAAGGMPQMPEQFTGQGIRVPGQQQPQAQGPYDLFVNAANDPDRLNKLMGIRNDQNVNPVLRRIASAEAAEDLSNATKKADAEDRIKKMSQTELARELQRKDTEGSWGRRILFGLLGMEAAVKDEEAKLGIGAKWQTTTITDTKSGETRNVLVKTRADGLPMVGYDADSGSKLDAKTLASVPTGTAKLAEVGADTFADPTGVVKGNWVLERKAGQSVYRQVGTNKVATPEEANALRKIGVQGTLSDQRARLIQEANIKLQGKAGEEAMAIQRQYNQLLVSNGFPPMQPGETPITAPQIAGETPPAAAAPAAPAPAPAQAAAAAPAAAAPAQQGGGRPAAVQQGGGAVAPARPAPAPAPAPVAGPAIPSVGGGGGMGGRPTATALEARSAAATAGAQEAAKNAPLVRRADEEAFVKFKNDDILPKADTGARLAGIRRDQISGPDGVLNNPEIAGLLSGTGSQAREFQNLFRDIVGGTFDKVDDMSTRIKQANLDPRMKEVLQIQLQRQREVTPLLIREVAPVGAITDFEQRMAKDAGIDVMRQGLYASLTNLTRSQFQSDVAAYKSVFAERNPQLRTRTEFDRAWNAEKARLDASYRKVYEDRAKYLGQYNRDGSNNNATIVAFRDHYPVPSFDRSTGQFTFSGYSRNAERPPLSSFERR